MGTCCDKTVSIARIKKEPPETEKEKEEKREG